MPLVDIWGGCQYCMQVYWPDGLTFSAFVCFVVVVCLGIVVFCFCCCFLLFVVFFPGFLCKTCYYGRQ